MINPNPECPRDDCRFTNHRSYTTSAYYPPIYDKNGVNTNPDRNTTTSALECLTCGKRWSCISQLGETVYISTSAGLTKYQKSRGIDTSKRRRLS